MKIKILFIIIVSGLQLQSFNIQRFDNEIDPNNPNYYLLNEGLFRAANEARVQYGLKPFLHHDILQKVDRATMTHSLEGREPFLDHRIIEWAAQLPLEYKYNNGTKKYILREIAHQYVPKEMLNRPKMGFGIPVEQWLTVDLKHIVETFFEIKYLEKQNIFNVIEVRKIIDAFYNGKKERAEKIWYLLMFQMWYDKWMK